MYIKVYKDFSGYDYTWCTSRFLMHADNIYSVSKRPNKSGVSIEATNGLHHQVMTSKEFRLLLTNNLIYFCDEEGNKL